MDMILDHLIAVVPDLRQTHRHLLDQGFDEAWPPGPFWPNATTSGIALGGANLELIQPDEDVRQPQISTLVFAPGDADEAASFLRSHGLAFDVRTKIEPDPHLLVLRGFPPALAATPQEICTNHYPVDPPYPFFLCSYAPFLLERLAPAKFSAPFGSITGLLLKTPDPEIVERLIASALGPISFQIEPGAVSEVAEIRFAGGQTLSVGDL